MFALIVQTVLLIATAFILGCIIGCLLWRLFSPAVRHEVRSENQADAQVAHQRAPVDLRPDETAKPIEQTPDTPVRSAEAMPAAALAEQTTPEKKTEPKTHPVGTVGDSLAPTDLSEPSEPSESTSVAPPVGAPAEAGERDNLKRIRGIGPQNESRLNNVGVWTFRQIAGWSVEDQRAMGELMAFPGRIEREGWVAQAIELAEGKDTDFSKRVDSGSVTTSIGTAAESGLGSKPDALLLEAPRDGAADDLTRIRGIGSALQVKLERLGIYHYQQIAAMSSDELRWLDTALGFPGRAERENWQQDAKHLSEGGSVDQATTDGKADMITSRQK